MSWQAYLLDWTVKRRVKRKLGATLDVERMRRTFDKAAFPPPKGVVYEAGSVGGVGGEWVKAAHGPPGRRLLYLHGGGFVACSARTHRPITGAFALRGFDVFVPNYRLAPEHPFPAGLDDVTMVWRNLSAQGSTTIAGDSAGGNLALALLLRARAEGLPMPAAAAVFSPATDLLGTSASRLSNATRDAMFTPGVVEQLRPLYLGDADPAQPFASPLYGDLAGLPPLLLHVGEREMLRDDSIRFAEKAQAAGVIVSLKVWPVVPHVWQMAHDILPEGRQSLDAAAAFLKSSDIDRRDA